jgi:hypothetical protein
MKSKQLLFRYAYYVPGLQKKLLSISCIMKHSPHLDIVFDNNRCLFVAKKSKKAIVMGVEEQGLFPPLDGEEKMMVTRENTNI